MGLVRLRRATPFGARTPPRRRRWPGSGSRSSSVTRWPARPSASARASPPTPPPTTTTRSGESLPLRPRSPPDRTVEAPGAVPGCPTPHHLETTVARTLGYGNARCQPLLLTRRATGRPPARRRAPGRDRQPTRWPGSPAANAGPSAGRSWSTPPSTCSAPRGGAARRCAPCARRPGSNPRYFYESFDDLDALVVAVYDRLVADLTTAIIDAVDAARRRSRRPDARRHRQHRGVRRRRPAAGARAVRRGPRQRGAQPAAHRDGARPRRRGRAAHHRPPRAATAGEQIGLVGAAVLVGGTSELVLAWLDGRIDVPRDQLVDDATALFLAVGEAAAAVAAGRQTGPTRA